MTKWLHVVMHRTLYLPYNIPVAEPVTPLCTEQTTVWSPRWSCRKLIMQLTQAQHKDAPTQKPHNMPPQTYTTTDTYTKQSHFFSPATEPPFYTETDASKSTLHCFNITNSLTSTSPTNSIPRPITTAPNCCTSTSTISSQTNTPSHETLKNSSTNSYLPQSTTTYDHPTYTCNTTWPGMFRYSRVLT